MRRDEVINHLIRKYGYKSYLEIGVDEGGYMNDQKIVIGKKTSVDPAPKSRATHNMTSDQFFEMNDQMFDIIFIDGLHHCDQVLRDVENSLAVLNTGGTIVMHDCNPTSEAQQIVPRIQGDWTGDVWKAFVHYRRRPDLSMCVIDTDFGCGIIRRGSQVPLVVDNPTYAQFTENKNLWLNLISVTEFNPDVSKELMSVCIPCYEQRGFGVKYMTELLNSISRQRGLAFEVVVSDNSRDNRIEHLCRKYKSINLRYFRNNSTYGTSNNTNNAISKAAGGLIKIMYSDDLLLEPNALYEFKKALGKRHWAVSWSKSMNKAGKVYHLHKAHWNDRLITGRNTIGMPSVMAMRKNEFTFDPNITTLLDCEYYWLLKNRYGDPEWITKPLVGQRYWDGSMSFIVGDNKETDYKYLQKKHRSLASKNNLANKHHEKYNQPARSR